MLTDDYWEDREASKKLTGRYANRIYVQPLGNGMVRINFGEVLDEEPSYHSAIVVTAEQAIGFAHVIFNVSTELAEAEHQASSAVAAANFAAEQAASAAADAAAAAETILGSGAEDGQ